MNAIKDFFFAIFVALYTAFLFVLAIGGSMLILKLLLNWVVIK